MPISCEDLAQYGICLVPPSAPEYQPLVADIVNRLRSRPNGSPPVHDEASSFSSGHDDTSVVLLNRSSRAIASVAYIWHVRLSNRNGRVVTHSYSPGTNASVLLPFCLNKLISKHRYYWHAIFPGSKRLVRFNGSILGDNTDTRPPEPDELWHGGFFSSSSVDRTEGEPVKLSLDGVFFEDGGFAGPDQLGSWEQTVSAAETYLELGALAREARHSGMSADEFFRTVRDVTGQPEQGRLPPPPPPGLDRASGPLREFERSMVGWRVLHMRERLHDDVVIERVAEWSDAVIPKFHKL
jgi:hypothetical protein